MYTLYMIGPIIERLLGTGKFIAIFMLSGIAGSIGISLWAAISGTFSAYYTSTIGASGAIFGLFGALVVIHKRIGAQMGQLLGVLLINLAFPFFVPGIAWQAHVGGVLTGLLLAYLFVYAAPKMQFGEQSKLDSRKIWVVFTAGVAVLLIVIAFASSQVVLSRLDGLIVF
jgi:membrane associated rhomboid family serine protease